MGIKFKKIILAAVLPAALLGISSCAMMGGIDNEGDTRRVDGVMWSNQIDTDIDDVLEKEVANDKTRLVFIRKNDNHSEQTSANVSVNNRFQVSLHADNYTVVNSCVGTNQLSAHATGFKNNNLLADKQDYELTGGQTYFFHISMNEQGQSTLEQITHESALPLLANRRYQSHQISRVVSNCPLPVAVMQPITPSPVVEVKAPALMEKMTIDLEVLFETDKAIVRPDYYSKITEVAAFMKQYPNTVVTIEGHTDSRGKDAYNQALSQRRVNAVEEVLITQFGVEADRLSAIGYGESQPRASNDTVDGRQLNRRVVAVVEERARN
ncbi:OmpA family protein [Psychrobacter fjordensis]|uniref:OmpA family protein n=1 Tax=Psychrobacter fjordensis TaxID=664424 RepID=UPI0019185885|nr:OmpA family protein [Psychrobacter fjordensis]